MTPIVSPRLRPISTVLHAAPPPSSVASFIEKQPATSIGGGRFANADAGSLFRGQQVRRGLDDRPEHAIQLPFGPKPFQAKPTTAGGQALMPEGTCQERVQKLQIGGCRLAALGDRGEDPKQRLAQLD